MHRGSRQGIKEGAPVRPVRDAVVHQDDSTSIALPADQPAEALLEAQDGLRQRQLPERIGEGGAPCQLERVARNAEGQADDHDTGEGIARDVDPFPEAAAP